VCASAPPQHLGLVAVDLDRPIVIGEGGAHLGVVVARLPPRRAPPEVEHARFGG
jgi:hypothetical protein